MDTVRANRLLIADDAPTRVGIRTALEGIVTVCAEAQTADEAIAEAQGRRPDLCLIGLEIEGGGLAAVRAISAAIPEATIIVLSDRSDPDDLLASARAGAVGFLPRAAHRQGLRRAIEAVIAGQAVVPRRMMRELVRELQAVTGSGGGLSSREAQVLGMLRRGQHTSAIAHRLDISPVTVRRHVSAIVRKAGVCDRAALLKAADVYEKDRQPIRISTAGTA